MKALFAGIAVSDHDAALTHYERLLGPATFKPHGKETVWDIAEERSVYIVETPEVAGGARAFVMVDDLDAAVAEIRRRGLEPTREETYPSGVRKSTYVDADGNEFGFLSTPVDD